MNSRWSRNENREGFFATLAMFFHVAWISLFLVGCDSFRNKVEKQTIRVERRDSAGRPIKIGFIASDKPVKVPVKYETEDGQFNVEVVDVNGFDVSPPPLTQKP